MSLNFLNLFLKKIPAVPDAIMMPVKGVPLKLKDLSFIIVATMGGVWTIRVVTEWIQLKAARRKEDRMLERWATSPKDVVIVHAIARGLRAPSPSPFVLKLETFLRMAEIPYEMDHLSPWSKNRKTPWITLNGEHIADSQIIIEFLEKKFGLSIGSSYSAEEKAIARAVRIMMDEHFYWGLGLWRYVYSQGEGLAEVTSINPVYLYAFYQSANARVKMGAFYQGIGRHDMDTVINIMKENLKTVSTILGRKKFLLGEQPCVEDCSVFGFVAQVVYCAPGSPYEKYLEEELPNLKEYCLRMKDRFWPNWEECLARPAAI